MAATVAWCRDDAEVVVNVAVVGVGTMGVGIAHRFAARGATVVVVDIDEATASAAADRVAATLHTAEQRGKLSRDEADSAVAAVSAVGTIDDVPAGFDLIVEAVVEHADLKVAILAEAEARRPVVLATNTSSISINSLAGGLAHPERFAGMHFFNPVWAIDLVEVVRGSHTSGETLARIEETVHLLGMRQAVINDSPGFATSRLGVLVGLEAIRMVEQGVGSAESIDTAMSLGYRHPMGPLMLGDLVGLDVRLDIADHLASVYGDRFAAPDLLRSMVADGLLGKKSGVGFYDWSSGSAVPIQE
ncbi:MAG: 3-hydroxyacyl-CoA dehydrogenase family protein [Acidimicrobiia bacterium]